MKTHQRLSARAAAPLALAFLGVALAVASALASPPAKRYAVSRAVSRPGWADADLDGRDTREQILAERCISAPGQVVCLDGYTGERIETPNPSRDLELDHLYPWAVAVARMPGWGQAGRRAFVNDPRNLVVTSRAVNRAKGARMPGAWCPPLPAARIAAAARLELVAEVYGLPLTESERAALAGWRRGECGS